MTNLSVQQKMVSSGYHPPHCDANNPVRALVSSIEGSAHNANPARAKLQDYEIYRQVLGIARYTVYVVAPIVHHRP